MGWVKAKVVRRGEGGLKVSPPLPPPRKILIIHCVISGSLTGVNLSASFEEVSA